MKVKKIEVLVKQSFWTNLLQVKQPINQREHSGLSGLTWQAQKQEFISNMPFSIAPKRKYNVMERQNVFFFLFLRSKTSM